MLPILETSRLLLRPRTLADTGACLAMDGDPAVVRYVAGPWSDPLAHRAFVEARTVGPYPPGLGYWVVGRRGEAGSFLGWVLLIPADGTRPEIEIGWRLLRSEWGRGFATEAARAVVACVRDAGAARGDRRNRPGESRVLAGGEEARVFTERCGGGSGAGERAVTQGPGRPSGRGRADPIVASRFGMAHSITAAPVTFGRAGRFSRAH